MTRDEIGKEYNQAAATLGEKVYRFFLPVLEMHQILLKMLQLNQEAWKLGEAEKKTAAEKKIAVVSEETSVETVAQ
jgi:hypothetical protein